MSGLRPSVASSPRQTPTDVTRTLPPTPWHRRILAAFACTAATACFAQAQPGSVTVRQGAGSPACEIRLDGDDSEPCWASAAVHSLPHEFRPRPGSLPSVETRYRLLQDAENLYVLVEADDPEPRSMRYAMGRRDKIGNDQDSISLYVDPIGGRMFAQMFRVNPVGSVTDGTYNEASASLSLDQDFDFAVATRVTDGGWTAEFRIPFRALRYAGRGEAAAAWTLLVVRNYPRDDRFVYANSPIHPNSDCFLCKNPLMSGIQPPDSPRYWQATPYAVAHGERGTRGGQRRSGSSTDIGMDVKARVGASTFLDLTVNPDFSQVELDAPQLAANARFGLFYREKRPFFLEGADLFDAPLQLQYTRTIGDPRAGVRLTHRSERVEALAILTQDRGGTAIMYPGAFSSYPIVRHSPANVALLRSRTAVTPALSIGATASVRDHEDGERNDVLAADAAWQVDDRHKLRFLAAGSDTRNDARHRLEGAEGPPPRRGGAFFVDHSYYGRHWDTLLTFERVGNQFRSANGFIGQAGYARSQAIVAYRFGHQGWFTEVKPYLTVEDNQALPGGVVYRNVRPALQLLGPATGIFLEGHFDQARAERGRPVHRLNQMLMSLRWTPGPTLTVLQLDLEPGRRLDYATDLVGPGLRTYGELGLRLGRRTEVSVRMNHERIRHSSVGTLLSDGTAEIVAAHSLSATSWLRLIAQTFRTASTDPASQVRNVTRRHVGSLVYSFVPWSDGSLSLGLSADSRDDGAGGRDRAREAFVKLQHSFARGF